jgi:hypothetical protein
MSEPLQARVAQTADGAGLHAPVPTLLLELQSLLGALSAAVATETERGRRPYRPGPQWGQRLGELAYGVYLLADQTGVEVAQSVELTARQLDARGRQARATDQHGWPFEG